MLTRRDAVFGSALLAGLPASGGAAATEADSHAVPQRHASSRRHHRPLVLLDPGHGGKDPGCIGVHGTLEKHVALALGLELRRQILASGRYRVAMTRDTDVFIPLADRVARARRLDAALIVSLHANASPDHTARGICVYRFAWRASDAHAASRARWENSAERYASPSTGAASRQVLHILASLMRRETQRHSAQLQRAIVEGLRPQVRMLPLAAPHARFAVLSAPDIAGVLVEMGFLTNRREEMLLSRKSHRMVLAQTMHQAIDSYFARLPPAAVGRLG
ncbi:MAG TPA: N-acetylmuramoyl-L-alanine amidase [Rhodopila sp.]